MVSIDVIWYLKVSFLSKVRPRCFWLTLFCAMLPLNIIFGWFAFVALLENGTSWACFEEYGLNDIFNLYAHSEILGRSWFKISADLLGFLTIWIIDVSSAKRLSVDFRFSDKSLM